MNDLISRKALMQHVLSNYKESPEKYQLLSDIGTFNSAFDLKDLINELEHFTMDELGLSEARFQMDKGEYYSYCTLTLYDVVELLKKYVPKTEEE